jgi:threonine synthase
MMEELGIIDRRPRLVCAQAENANPLYESYLKGFKEFKPKKAKKTLASAIQIGDPVSVQKAIYMLKEFDGVVEQASEDELSNAAALADTTGLFCCPHTGVALAALFKLRERGIIGSDDKVIVISTAHGLKFTDFKLKYHTGKLREVEAVHRNEPIHLAAKYEDVIDTINRELERRAG